MLSTFPSLSLSLLFSLRDPELEFFLEFTASGSLMARWVLSECGLKPPPKIYPQPRCGISSKTAISSHIRLCKSHILGLSLRSSSGFRGKTWILNVSAPSRVIPVGEDDKERVGINGVNGAEDDNEFDPGTPPDFKLADIRAAIPKHCWVKNPWRSMSYVVRDVVVVFGLAAVATFFNNWVVWPLYWIAQGTMFWALFVLGHDW